MALASRNEMCRLRRVNDSRPVDLRPGCEHMLLSAGLAEDVLYPSASDDQGVGDEGAVTPPRHCFGAHQRDGIASRRREDYRQVLRELGRLHVIGITLKGSIPPAAIG